MPATHNIDNEARLLITIWEGEARDRDLIEALIKYQEDIQSHPDYVHYNEVVDFRNVTVIKLTTEGIKNIGRIALLTDRNDVNRKVAFIVSSNLAFGLARMYEAYRMLPHGSCKEIRVFKKEKEAFDWVQQHT